MTSPDRSPVSEIEPKPKKVALAFPGQGRQEAGIGMDVIGNPNYPGANTLFLYGNRLINETLGYDINLKDVCQNNKDGLLNNDSEIAQATLTLIYLVRHQAYIEGKTTPKKPDIITAHSLGKIAALTVAGSITFTDAMKISVMRGRFTKEAAVKNPGTMGYINDIDPQTIEEICERVMKTNPGTFVSISNDNSPRQQVISGSTQAVQEVLKIAKAEPFRARYAEPLPIPYPSHCKMMVEAEIAMADFLKDIEIRVPTTTLVFNGVIIRPQDGQNGVENIRKMLATELTRKVSWPLSDKVLRILGVELLMEIGAVDKGSLTTSTKVINIQQYQDNPMEIDTFIA